MIDTHAHLDACADPPERLVERAAAAGVERIVTVGSGVDSCRAALAIAECHEGVYAVLGIHPHQSGDDGETARLDELQELLAHPKAVAVGETGLDYYRDSAPRQRQRALFRTQAGLAADLGKPLVVHSRAAEVETAATLAEVDGLPAVVLHCFSSSALLAPALERGYYVSFAGNVTYPRALELRAAAAAVPARRILAETDSPYLAPQQRRGRSNEPANVVHTLATLAEVRGERADELEARIDANASRAFSLP